MPSMKTATVQSFDRLVKVEAIESYVKLNTFRMSK